MNYGLKNEIVRYSFMVLACALYALGFCFFLEPFDIVSGGISGLSMVFEHYFPSIDTSLWLIILNMPIILLAIRQQGIKFAINCIITISTLSVIIAILHFIIDKYSIDLNFDNELVPAIYGGVLEGLSIGLFCKYRVSSGGTELLGRLIFVWTKKKTSIPLMSGMCDSIIVIIGVIAFQNTNNFFYAVIIIFIITKVSDTVIVGLQKAKVCYIITDKGEAVGKHLIQNSPRGVTLINGKGMYTNLERGVLITVVRKGQINKLKELVECTDENAFMIVSDTNEVLGKGFKKLKEKI